MFLTGSAFARLAASLAFAICSLRAFEELPVLAGVAAGAGAASGFIAALALAMWSRRAEEELATLRTVSGVFLTGASVLGELTDAPGGDTACPNMLPMDARVLGVRKARFLPLVGGRAFGVS